MVVEKRITVSDMRRVFGGKSDGLRKEMDLEDI